VDDTRPIRTYKARRGRVTPRQRAAIDLFSACLLPNAPLKPTSIWGPDVPVVAEIGFGTGAATVDLALAEPGIGILAIDVHTPGIGDLLYRLGQGDVQNVRVMEADALDVFETFLPPECLAGVRTFFPDPWPKARHHKRRLIQPRHVRRIASRVCPGGFWHLATDWVPYAEVITEVFEADPQWRGGLIPRPDRPITRYEQQAVDAGRTVTDFRFTKIAN
jgi:tRNA (guanine-N7-)-methyltransferase